MGPRLSNRSRNKVTKPASKISRSKLSARSKPSSSKLMPIEPTLSLLRREAKEGITTPICFWKPHGNYGWLGQWYPSSFTDPVSGLTFSCAEQYMMYQKAVTFKDDKIASAILETHNPMTMKALGRKIGGFDEKAWESVRMEIVISANLLKFGGKNACMADRGDVFVYPSAGYVEGTEEVGMKELLLATGERELVEASPLDRIWGVGFGPEKAPVVDRKKWGKNLLGTALMEARRRVREQEDM